MRGSTIWPIVPARCCPLGYRVVIQANECQPTAQGNQAGRKEHRIKQHRTLKQGRLAGHHQRRQHSTKAMTAGHARHIIKQSPLHAESLGSQLGVAIPANKTPAVIALTVPLQVTQPQIELLGQQSQHRLIGSGAKTVAMQKMQHGLTTRPTVPASQGKTGATSMCPGHQIH